MKQEECRMQKKYLQNLERNISMKQYTVQIADEARKQNGIVFDADLVL